MFKSLVEGSATTIPLMLTGGFSSAAAMNAALETKAVDVIGLARPLCTQPSLGVEAWKALAKTHILQEEESFFFFFLSFLFDRIMQGQVLKAISCGLRGTGQVSARFQLKFYFKQINLTQAQAVQGKRKRYKLPKASQSRILWGKGCATTE